MHRPPGVWYDVTRYSLALLFILYGGVKLANIQFNPTFQPALFQPTEADQLTGAQLTWRFFGYSRAYQCLIGLGEVGAGLLLLWSRTALLGAILYLPIIVNIVAVDLFYGVEVDATTVAMALLIGDLALLLAERERIQAAFLSLLGSPAGKRTPLRVVLSWVLAAGLVVGVVALGWWVRRWRDGF